MLRIALTSLGFLLGQVTQGQDAPQVPPAAAPAPQPPKYNPNDPQSIIDYIISEARGHRYERDLVLRRLRQNELERLLSGLPADVKELQDGIAKATREVRIGHDSLYVATTALQVLMQKVQDNPDDLFAINYLRQRLSWEFRPEHFITDPDAAAKKLAPVKAVIAAADATATTGLAKGELVKTQRELERLEKNIALSKEARNKQQALIGQEAPQLVVETWLNGTSLSADDLKDKVVLLCFFSPVSFEKGQEDGEEDWRAHLKQLAAWHSKYAGRGLIVINLTDYSNMRWDDAQQAPVRGRPNTVRVPPEEERAMLAKLARAQGWTQRVAIQQRDEHIKTIMHYPALSQQTVVIDRQGKIRFVRGGVCEQFTREIGELLDPLLGPADGRE